MQSSSVHIEVTLEDSLLEVVRLGARIAGGRSRLGSLRRRCGHLRHRPGAVVGTRRSDGTGTRR